MRLGLLVVILFVALYVGVTAVGANKHSSEKPPSSDNRPALPSSLSLDWSLVPNYLKVQPSEVTVTGTQAGPRAVTMFPLVTSVLQVSPSTKRYRMMQLQLESGAQVALSYPPAMGPIPSKPPDPLSPDKPKQTIVLPQAGGQVTLTCSGLSSCAVSY